jgi:hypothetical protein
MNYSLGMKCTLHKEGQTPKSIVLSEKECMSMIQCATLSHKGQVISKYGRTKEEAEIDEWVAHVHAKEENTDNKK